MRATISLSPATRAHLYDDGSALLERDDVSLRLEPIETARLAFLLGGAAADELRRMLHTLAALRDTSPEPAVRVLARELLRDGA